MNDIELLRVVDFITHTRQPFVELVAGAEVDASWTITSHLIRAGLLQEPLSITQLIQVSGLPYGTATRRIQRLIESGLINKVAAGELGKSYLLQASSVLRESFIQYAQRIKALLAEAMGQRLDTGSDEHYHFGDLHTSIADRLPPETLRLRLASEGKGLTFLFAEDNYFTSLRDLWTDFRANAGSREDFTLLKLPELYDTLLSNATLPESTVDIVALNFPWLSEFADKELIAPLDEAIEEGVISGHDFHPTVWETGAWQARQYGVPLYLTVETVAARRDLFSDANLPYPRTLKELLDAARRLHAPRRGRYGLSWNGARGMPIATAFMFLLDAHGGAVLTRGRTEAVGSGANPDQWRASLDSDAAVETLKFMRELLTVSAPEVLMYDWNRSMNEFMVGKSAMCYLWSMRAARFEFDLASKVKGLVHYLPHPNISGVRCSSPIGGFLLAVPSNLPQERAKLAVQAIKWMTSAGSMRNQIRNGFPVAPLFSVSSDPEMRATSPIVGFVDRLAKQGLLSNSMRPLTPVYTRIEEVLGEEVHAALTNSVSDNVALARAQSRTEALLEASVRWDRYES
ncbi:extracellular solute-binding protein [Variovorax sp. PAMC28562]|uniref:extracellular solute-binding protein n=1 Tax=Variovorax sp. PAMC28562 TaxID=2762323 RepID=UPI00164DBB05|nr:extracellular solute-binding protein [Variovorax sp. PAMC28562]QNK75119.1 extracellular solute-binding protein [Variovorax sp. PAMC28562]